MGVDVYVLAEQNVRIYIGNEPISVGALRQCGKITELTAGRSAALRAAEWRVRGLAAPNAAMLAPPCNLCLAGEPNRAVKAHLTLGWEPDRSFVTDWAWDYLPILGYAVRRDNGAGFDLHEERRHILYPIASDRAMDLGILNSAGRFQPKGQPAIADCVSVARYVSGYVTAKCSLEDGRIIEVHTAVNDDIIPDKTWYVARRPRDVVEYALT